VKRVRKRPRYPYVTRGLDRHGRERQYFRRGKGRRIPIPGIIGSPEFVEAYAAACAEYGIPFEAKTVKERRPRKAKSGAGRIYFVQGLPSLRIKIGFSVAPRKRLKALSTGSPERLRLLCTIKGTQTEERALHHKFREYRIGGEWFHSSQPLLDHIDKLRAAGQYEDIPLAPRKEIIL